MGDLWSFCAHKNEDHCGILEKMKAVHSF